jgi:hypothetical protein
MPKRGLRWSELARQIETEMQPRDAAHRAARRRGARRSSVLSSVDKEGGDSLFAKSFGGLQPVQTLN